MRSHPVVRIPVGDQKFHIFGWRSIIQSGSHTIRIPLFSYEQYSRIFYNLSSRSLVNPIRHHDSIISLFPRQPRHVSPIPNEFIQKSPSPTHKCTAIMPALCTQRTYSQPAQCEPGNLGSLSVQLICPCNYFSTLLRAVINFRHRGFAILPNNYLRFVPLCEPTGARERRVSLGDRLRRVEALVL